MAIYTPAQLQDIRNNTGSNYDLLLEQALETVNLTLSNQTPYMGQFTFYLSAILPCTETEKDALTAAVEQALTDAGWVITANSVWQPGTTYFMVSVDASAFVPPETGTSEI